MADQLFNQADSNRDQRLDINEFRNLIAQNLGPNASIYLGNGSDEAGPYANASYGTSGSPTYADINAYETGYENTNLGASGGRGGGGGATPGGQENFNSYEQSSYRSSAGLNSGGFDVSAASHVDVTDPAALASSSSSYETSSTQHQVQQYATSAQGLYQDPNPQIIRRPATGGAVTYTQNIKIRFLQPPPIPPPGPLIIKEVRPPQPPPPPPLVVRQRAPSLPQPPPLILRERPPTIPASATAQTIIRNLPPLPVPPRSVIIERLPALPPKPRDIIIERWIPYSAMSKRKTIVHRAEAAKPYPQPRNVIIQYESPQVRVIRQFQRLGVTPENPQEYLQRYGASLFDTQALVQQARAAGVVEDISPPTNFPTSPQGNASSFNAEFSGSASGVEAAGGAARSSSFESSNYNLQQGGYESIPGGEFSSSYQAGSFLQQGGDPFTDGNGAGSYDEHGTDLANAAFNSADLNRDGSIDANEFRQYLSSQGQ